LRTELPHEVNVKEHAATFLSPRLRPLGEAGWAFSFSDIGTVIEARSVDSRLDPNRVRTLLHRLQIQPRG